MATKLNKAVTRETAIVKDGKTILATMTPENELVLRRKSDRHTGAVISFSDLWDQFNEVETSEIEPHSIEPEIVKPRKVSNPKVVQHILDKMHISGFLTYDETVKFTQIVKEAMNDF